MRTARVSIIESTVDNLRNEIIGGKYKVGDKFATEAKLCKKYNVSRTTVREATKILSAEGYIVIVRGKGAFINSVDKQSLFQDSWDRLDYSCFMKLIEMRIVLEDLAVKLAATNATDELILKIDDNYVRFCDANEKMDYERLMVLDEEFHSLIAQASGNEFLVDVMGQIRKAYRPFREASFCDTDTYSNAKEPHRQILMAIKKRDPDAAMAAMRYHMQLTIQDVSPHFGK